MPGSPIMEEEVFESSPDFFLEIYLGFEELNNALKIEFPEFRERDLHLAAELGKTLLERNKELENSIKNYQSTIDDQALEIEYLKKQVAAMKEVNNSRLKVYENLETVINDLEHMNQQLESERSKDKNKITSLRKMIDEIQNRYHDLEDKYETIKRDQKTSNAPTSPNHRLTQDGSIQIDAVSTSSSSDPEADDAGALRRRLQEAHEQRNSVQQKVAALAEQIASLTQERTETQEQLRELESELAGLKKDNAYLEQIRKSQMCRECKAVIDRGDETPSLRIDDDVIDECSLHESLGHMGYEDPSFALQEELGAKVREAALEEDSTCRESYRLLVEKYEALVKVHQNAPRRKHSGSGVLGDFRLPASSSGGYQQPHHHQQQQQQPPSAGLSLQEELQMSGEFSSNLTTSGESGLGGVGASPRGHKLAKPFAGTPTDFSEAETSSSGFADETSNKATQTEGRPGSFLCSIADGDDCRFSIYDDTSTFESRFHQTPEYRKLFSEIFEVLKRAAEAKDVLSGPGADGEAQPGEDALTPVAEQGPAGFGLFEDAPSEATDDANSVVSLAVSSVASEPVFRVRTPLFGRRQPHQPQAQQAQQAQLQQQQQPSQSEQSGRALHVNTRRQPLDYLSVQVRKRGSGKRGRRAGAETAPAPSDVAPTTNPRVSQLRAGAGGRRKFRPLTASEFSDAGTWNGSTAHFYPSKSARTGRHQQQQQLPSQHPGAEQQQQANGHASPGDYKPGSASEEVAKLLRLEKSYAEVLRMPNKSKTGGSPRQRRHH